MRGFLERYKALLESFVLGDLGEAKFVKVFEEQITPRLPELGARARCTLSLSEDIDAFKRADGSLDGDTLHTRARVNLEMTKGLLNAPWGLTVQLTEWIEETTVGDLAGAWAAMANCSNGEYELPDGTVTRGPSCVIVLGDESQVVVGKGSEVTTEGKAWQVTKVSLNPGGLGSVDLETTVESIRRKARNEEVDFFFLDHCDACGGRAGWYGLIEGSGDRLHIGMWCIRCPTYYTMTGGKIRKAFLKDPPEFTPGRVAD
jgi:hypothetical protein